MPETDPDKLADTANVMGSYTVAQWQDAPENPASTPAEPEPEPAPARVTYPYSPE